MKKFLRQFNISNCACKNGICTLPHLMGMMLQISEGQSIACHSSTEELMEKGLTWMIYKWQVRIFRYPKAGEEIAIRTWANGFQKLYANRTFWEDWSRT